MLLWCAAGGTAFRQSPHADCFSLGLGLTVPVGPGGGGSCEQSGHLSGEATCTDGAVCAFRLGSVRKSE